jgi:septum formation inhibitor-activating ATPase MinD
VSEENVPDINVMDDILPEEIKSLVDELFADGGYYDHAKSQALIEQGFIPAIPPTETAVVHGKESTAWHDSLVSYIKQKGSF